MSKSRAVLTGPLFAALLAIIYCVWSALGNDVNFCVTTGCTLYQDFTIGGISLWWFGTGAFACLGACALLGQINAGRWFAALFVLGDICLLILMALTAPCVSCLVAAAFFALCYYLFRKQEIPSPRTGQMLKPGHSILLWAWLALFVINLGTVARSQIDIWPILDESGDARMRMFFSPSCKYCVEGIKALSGNVDVAFYPIAENDADVYRLAKMESLLGEGASMVEALNQSALAEAPTGFANFSPELILLRFRLLRNKAHIFAAGSQAVPFFETRGLPASIMARARQQQAAPRVTAPPPVQPEAASGPKDHALPSELVEGGQCGPGEPCPPDQQ